MKKTIITIGVILGIIAMGLGVYFAWKKSQEILTPPISDQQPITNNQQQLPSATEKLKVLSDQPVFDYWTITTGTSTKIFYINKTGQILKVNPPAGGGKDEIISSQTINNLQQAKSSNNGERILLKLGGADSPQFNIFNATNNIWELLPSGITTADFSPSNKEIAYLKTNGDKSDLIIKNLTASKTNKIISIAQNDFDLNWLTDEIILLTDKPSFYIDDDIWALNIKNKTIKKITSGRGLLTNWSPNGDSGIKFSVDQQRNSYLELINNDGTIRASFDFSTLPDKCVFDSLKIYCAVPQINNSIQKPAFPDDYLKRAVYFKDIIYKMDIEQNTFEMIYANPEIDIDASHLSISDNQLLFINRYDSKLYELILE
ncbi:MAG: hypothetical protein AAB516_01930 [Patescibacteria group bacterium]